MYLLLQEAQQRFLYSVFLIFLKKWSHKLLKISTTNRSEKHLKINNYKKVKLLCNKLTKTII